MILAETYTLSNGVAIPKLGLGTWFINDNAVVQAVQEAAQLGYRHFDTAQAYGNERGVGEGIRTCGVKRDELFVTTKLAAEVKEYEAAVAAIDGSLQTMGLEYIDLMIIHRPKPWNTFHKDEPHFAGNRAAWRALEEAYQAGKLRAIGLSNFEQADIANILDSCTVQPMVNQILAHISNTPHELIQYSQDQGMVVEAYKASVVAPFEYVNLPINVMWDVLIWQIFPGWLTWAGALLTIFSGSYVLYREHRLNKAD